MGGYLTYHISRQRDLPCLLFNPALFMRSVVIRFTAQTHYPDYNNKMNIVLGKKDMVVSSTTTYQELVKDNTIDRINFGIYSHLEHRIDIITFEKEFSKFTNSF